MEQVLLSTLLLEETVEEDLREITSMDARYPLPWIIDPVVRSLLDKY